MKAVILSILSAVLLLLLIIRIDIVTNDDGYYIEDGEMAIVIETIWTSPSNPEPLFIIVLK